MSRFFRITQQFFSDGPKLTIINFFEITNLLPIIVNERLILFSVVNFPTTYSYEKIGYGKKILNGIVHYTLMMVFKFDKVENIVKKWNIYGM